ncbi:transposase-like zinc-binding domain-containing protein, partial [Mobiluncus mulieris]|uniref:transposase-like zinc-binding domain-containing protein n=1 Tax=Mobiluncus mulieris TaxID=2052 RepID=UPI003D3478DA
MPRKPSNRKCLTCGKTGVKKNGTTTSGAIRWRCNNCGASWSNIRDDISHAALFDKFVNWLVNKQTLADLKIAYTTWVRKTEWCWRVEPVIPVMGEIYDYIQIGACQVFCVSGVRFVILLGIFRGSLGLVLVVLSASYSR